MLNINDKGYIEIFNFLCVFGALPKQLIMEKFDLEEIDFENLLKSKGLYEVEKGFYSVSPTVGRNIELCQLAWVSLMLPRETKYFVASSSPLKVVFLRNGADSNALCSLYLLDYKSAKLVKYVLSDEESFFFFIVSDDLSIEELEKINFADRNVAIFKYNAETLISKPNIVKV